VPRSLTSGSSAGPSVAMAVLSRSLGVLQTVSSDPAYSSLSSSSTRQRQSVSVSLSHQLTGWQVNSQSRSRQPRVHASEALDRATGQQALTQSSSPPLNGSLTKNGTANGTAGTGGFPRTTNGALSSDSSVTPALATSPLSSVNESTQPGAPSETRPGITTAAKAESSAGMIQGESRAGGTAKRDTIQNQSQKAVRGVRSSSSFVVGKEPETPPSIFEYFQSSASLDPEDSGPPRFFCPLDGRPREDSSQEVLPRLFFLPGIEGTGFGLALHHKSLAR